MMLGVVWYNVNGLPGKAVDIINIQTIGSTLLIKVSAALFAHVESIRYIVLL